MMPVKDKKAVMMQKTLPSLFIFILGVLWNVAANSQQQPQIVQMGDIRASDTVVGRNMDAPINRKSTEDKFWWSDEWYDNGILEVPVNHQVSQRSVRYTNKLDGTDVPAIMFRPKTAGKFPAVLFQHGRRGLDELTQRLARRIAARGFIVLAPNVYEARFIERYPIDHDEATEGDVNAGVDYLLSQPDISTSKICLFSHTRGGYYTLKVAVNYQRQQKDVACYVTFYPHWQNPNASEPMQIYQYAKELDSLNIPVLVFIGEYEQYQRRRSIETAVLFMKKAAKDIRLIIYPGVGRGFDFRPPNVRTFADDMATKDSNMRAAAFMKKHLARWEFN
jgi:carboxymethylenebutenolidase